MEPFSLLKFWRTSGDSSAVVDVRSRAPDTNADSDSDSDIGSDRDSFFDLELTRRTPPEEDSIGNLIEMECPVKPEPVSISKPQSPISLLKSGPKFRVFLLSFRKPKSDKPEPVSLKQRSRRFSSSSEDEIPIGSLISSDNSLRTKRQRQRSADFSAEEPAKNALPKYLKLIKPLYNRASRRCTAPDFRGGSPSWDQFSAVSPLSSPATLPPCSPRRLPEERRGSLGSGLRVVAKHLGKSRSGGVMSSPAVAQRRDDTLLLQNDGIQSAILHCKKSFNSTSTPSMLRACHEKSMSDTIEFNFERYRCSSL